MQAEKLPRKEMRNLNLAGKRVLIREDLNVPLKDGHVTSDARIVAALPTLRLALEAGAAVLVMSHLGRPQEGVFDAAYSLAPVAARIGQLLGRDVPLVDDWRSGISVAPGDIVMLENVRFLEGEKADADDLAKQLAGLCDIFVMDAFATAHRAQASTHGVARFAPVACAGPLLAAELEALERALADPRRPLVAIVGGSKVSTKLEVLDALAGLADQIIVGGGIANTFIAAAGYPVGKSLWEEGLVEAARQIAEKVQMSGAGRRHGGQALRRKRACRGEACRRRGRGRHDPGYWTRNRPPMGGPSGGCGDHTLEWARRGLRVRPVRRRDADTGGSHCYKLSIFNRRRRRYPGGDRQI